MIALCIGALLWSRIQQFYFPKCGMFRLFCFKYINPRLVLIRLICVRSNYSRCSKSFATGMRLLVSSDILTNFGGSLGFGSQMVVAPWSKLIFIQIIYRYTGKIRCWASTRKIRMQQAMYTSILASITVEFLRTLGWWWFK